MSLFSSWKCRQKGNRGGWKGTACNKGPLQQSNYNHCLWGLTSQRYNPSLSQVRRKNKVGSNKWKRQTKPWLTWHVLFYFFHCCDSCCCLKSPGPAASFYLNTIEGSKHDKYHFLEDQVMMLRILLGFYLSCWTIDLASKYKSRLFHHSWARGKYVSVSFMFPILHAVSIKLQ